MVRMLQIAVNLVKQALSKDLSGRESFSGIGAILGDLIFPWRG
jgi:hypothetical protein